MEVKVKVVSEGAVIPSMATSGSAGFDFYASEDVSIPAGSAVAVPTGLVMEIPSGYHLEIRPRSGLSLKYPLIICNSPGTVDSDYRGEIKILIRNLWSGNFLISKGERIAQGVFMRHEIVSFEIVPEVSITSRGTGGFGSTGI